MSITKIPTSTTSGFYFDEYINPISPDIEQLKKDLETAEINSDTMLKLTNSFDAVLLKIDTGIKSIQTAIRITGIEDGSKDKAWELVNEIWGLVKNVQKSISDFAKKEHMASFSKIDLLAKDNKCCTSGISSSTSFVYSASSSSSSSSSSSASYAAGSEVCAVSKKKALDDPFLKQAYCLFKQIPFFEDENWLKAGIKRLSKFNLRIPLKEEFLTTGNEPEAGATIEERVYFHLFALLSAESLEILNKEHSTAVDEVRISLTPENKALIMQKSSVQQRKEILTRVSVEVAIYGLSQITKNYNPQRNTKEKEQAYDRVRVIFDEIEGLRITSLKDYRTEKEIEKQKTQAKSEYRSFFRSIGTVGRNGMKKELDKIYEDAYNMARRQPVDGSDQVEREVLLSMASTLDLIWAQESSRCVTWFI